MSDLASRLTQIVGSIRLVDTHEHLLSEEERNRAAHDFGYLFPHYASSDLVSSGMPPALLEAVRGAARPVLMERMARIGWIRKPPPFVAPTRADLSLEERWSGTGAILGPDQAHRLWDVSAHRHPRPFRRGGTERADVRAAFRRHREVSPRGLVPARPERESRNRREHPGRLPDGCGSGSCSRRWCEWSTSRAPRRAAISGISSPTRTVPSTPWTT